MKTQFDFLHLSRRRLRFKKHVFKDSLTDSKHVQSNKERAKISTRIFSPDSNGYLSFRSVKPIIAALLVRTYGGFHESWLSSYTTRSGWSFSNAKALNGKRRRNTFRNLLRKPINFESNHGCLVFASHTRTDPIRTEYRFEALIIGVVPIRIDCLTAHIHTAFYELSNIWFQGRFIEFHPPPPLPSPFRTVPVYYGVVLLIDYAPRLLLINDLPGCFNVFNRPRYFRILLLLLSRREREREKIVDGC